MSPSSRSAKSFFLSVTLVLVAAYILYNYFQDSTPIQELEEQLTLEPSEIKNDVGISDSMSLQEAAANAISETNLGKAEKIFNQILENDPKNIEALYGLGVVYLQSGNADRATEMFHDVFNLEPGKIQEVLSDPRLEGIKTSSHFQDLLRLHDISIPEMNSHLISPPVTIE